LFEAMLVHKPAGIAKHFNMALIHHRLSQQGLNTCGFLRYLRSSEY
jgi:Chromatin modification-related protein EAF7